MTRRCGTSWATSLLMLCCSPVPCGASPDLKIGSFVQYDTDSRSVGTNTRVRWTFTPVGEFFLIYNHNLRSVGSRWQLDSNQLLVKFQYAFRS